MATLDEAAALAQQSDLPTHLPSLNSWITLCDLGNGSYVVKNINDRTYFSTGEEEFFILQQLQANSPRSLLKQSYTERFAESLDDADLDSFLAAIERKGLISGLFGQSQVQQLDSEDEDIDDEDEIEVVRG